MSELETAIAQLKAELETERQINKQQQQQIARMTVMMGLAIAALFGAGQLEKVLGGNLLQVMERVESLAVVIGVGGSGFGAIAINRKSEAHQTNTEL